MSEKTNIVDILDLIKFRNHKKYEQDIIPVIMKMQDLYVEMAKHQNKYVELHPFLEFLESEVPHFVFETNERIKEFNAEYGDL